jgi:PPK2 family polyphosphate:nucleotide phosphotransferase
MATVTGFFIGKPGWESGRNCSSDQAAAGLAAGAPSVLSWPPMPRRRPAAAEPHLVPFDGGFTLADFPTAPPAGAPGKEALQEELRDLVDELDRLQQLLFADQRFAVLAVFQAMDAAGKDSTIRKVFSGVNPAGFRVHAFGRPSELELRHDFLWRCAQRLPERGRIGIFNRSHYEEVLVVRVHPELLAAQRLPEADADRLWRERFDSIREFERHLSRNGTVIVKFWLNVSRREQAARLRERIEDPDKNWKFRLGDLDDRAHWRSFMQAYEDALRQTSREWAPWHAIPADDKPYMRVAVARVMVATMRRLGLRHPPVDAYQRRELAQGLKRLDGE